uniref:Transmembrane protein 218 n=1 Tax=Sinocyclocheilus rhinocerous TaxID=307959 RepID=A0A673HUH9_9TELE
MADVVLGVGTGVFIIALIWIVTLALNIVLSRATGIISIFLLALTITLVLVFFPRAPEVPSLERAVLVKKLKSFLTIFIIFIITNFIITFYQFNTSLLNKSINFFNKKKINS